MIKHLNLDSEIEWLVNAFNNDFFSFKLEKAAKSGFRAVYIRYMETPTDSEIVWFLNPSEVEDFIKQCESLASTPNQVEAVNSMLMDYTS